MRRDEFIKKSLRVGLVSGCIMAAGESDVFSQEDIQLKKCRITVLKKTLHEDIVSDFASSDIKICNRVEVGQEFIVEDPFTCPQGLCHWAWADIRHDIYACTLGGERPWANPPDVAITCCTDGYRPVFFRIEGIQE